MGMPRTWGVTGVLVAMLLSVALPSTAGAPLNDGEMASIRGGCGTSLCVDGQSTCDKRYYYEKQDNELCTYGTLTLPDVACNGNPGKCKYAINNTPGGNCGLEYVGKVDPTTHQCTKGTALVCDYYANYCVQ